MAKSIERYLRMMPKAHGLKCGVEIWNPATDVYKTRDGWFVKMELAGVEPDELDGHGSRGDPRPGQLPPDPGRVDREDALDLVGIQLDVQSRSEADLEHDASKTLDRALPMPADA